MKSTSIPLSLSELVSIVITLDLYSAMFEGESTTNMGEETLRLLVDIDTAREKMVDAIATLDRENRSHLLVLAKVAELARSSHAN